MCNDTLIEIIETDCPICNQMHKVEIRKRTTQALVKNTIVDYEEIYYLCTNSEDEDENEYIPAKVMDKNLLKARDAYRTKMGLLTSAEIAQIRNCYGLSQRDFAFLLGWGEVTITRYESKTIQDETYDNIMRMAYNNPGFAIQCLGKHWDKFSKDKLQEIFTTLQNKQIQKDEAKNKQLKMDIKQLGDFAELYELKAYQENNESIKDRYAYTAKLFRKQIP